jgi:hypothetical protein
MIRRGTEWQIAGYARRGVGRIVYSRVAGKHGPVGKIFSFPHPLRVGLFKEMGSRQPHLVRDLSSENP